jgi:hypothetical protein
MNTYTFDLVLNDHVVSAVNGKTGDVNLVINDISGLQTAISNTKFDGNLNGNLNATRGLPANHL